MTESKWSLKRVDVLMEGSVYGTVSVYCVVLDSGYPRWCRGYVDQRSLEGIKWRTEDHGREPAKPSRGEASPYIYGLHDGGIAWSW